VRSSAEGQTPGASGGPARCIVRSFVLALFAGACATHGAVVAPASDPLHADLVEAPPAARPEPGDAPMSQRERVRLASSYVAAGDLPKAAEVWRSGIEGAGRDDLAECHLGVGDVAALAGDLESAKASWREVMKVLPGEGSSGCLDQTKNSAAVRLMLIGRAAPELGAWKWIGGDPVTLDSLRGKVVLLQVFDTSCGPCRGALMHVRDLRLRHAGEDFVVVGVTEPRDRGFLPTAGTRDVWGDGRWQENLAEPGRFEDHLVEFRDRIGVGFPFAIAEKGQLGRYLSPVAENIVVIDRDGRTAFATPGSSQMEIVEAFVARLLEKK
jgi:hypothetical protein